MRIPGIRIECLNAIVRQNAYMHEQITKGLLPCAMLTSGGLSRLSTLWTGRLGPSPLTRFPQWKVQVCVFAVKKSCISKRITSVDFPSHLTP